MHQTPTMLRPTRVNDYLVGAHLDEAIAAGHNVEISWPFAEGDIADWTQAEALWKYVVFNQLHLRRAQMGSPVLLSIMPGLSREAYEHICLLFFERFNVAGFGILDRPVTQFYAAISGAQLSGTIVDIDREHTDVTPIYDGFVQHAACISLPLGLRDCQRYLAQLLRGNTAVVAALSPPASPLAPEMLQAALLELVQHLWTEGLIKVLAAGEAADLDDNGVTDIAAVLVAGKEKVVIETGMKKRASARASVAEQGRARAREIEALDLVTVQFREPVLTGKRDVPILPLQTAVGEAVARCEVDQRAYIWQSLFVTGEITNHIKGLGAALQARLAPYILMSSDLVHNEVQPRSIHVLKVPDYFAEYREGRRAGVVPGHDYRREDHVLWKQGRTCSLVQLCLAMPRRQVNWTPKTHYDKVAKRCIEDIEIMCDSPLPHIFYHCLREISILIYILNLEFFDIYIKHLSTT